MFSTSYRLQAEYSISPASLFNVVLLTCNHMYAGGSMKGPCLPRCSIYKYLKTELLRYK
jgi:hypothetical protein